MHFKNLFCIYHIYAIYTVAELIEGMAGVFKNDEVGKSDCKEAQIHTHKQTLYSVIKIHIDLYIKTLIDTTC